MVNNDLEQTIVITGTIGGGSTASLIQYLTDFGNFFVMLGNIGLVFGGLFLLWYKIKIRNNNGDR